MVQTTFARVGFLRAVILVLSQTPFECFVFVGGRVALNGWGNPSDNHVKTY